MQPTPPPSRTTVFQSTLPMQRGDQEDALRLSDFQRGEQAAAIDALLTAPDSKLYTTLSPSLLADLRRFEEGSLRGEPGDNALEALEVLAACLRHAKALTLQVAQQGTTVPLTLYPREGLYRCSLAHDRLWGPSHPRTDVLRVEPAFPAAPQVGPGVADRRHLHPLRSLLWAVAMHGRREHLLPELSGKAAYRVGPDLHLEGIHLTDAQGWIISVLRDGAATLRELAEVPGLGDDGAARLLNALYLLGGLIISRTHPAANRAGADARLRRRSR